MILAAVTSFISIVTLFIEGHYRLSLVLVLLNMLMCLYMLYGKLLHNQFLDKINFKKDALVLIVSALITVCMATCLKFWGGRELQISNADVMLTVVYILILATVFITIKIQQEEKQ